MTGALLEVSGVSVTFDGFRAINNLSFSIGPAEMRAIIGPNGAGKTTFMDIVTGKTKPDEGSVLWGERSISLLKMSESQIAQAGVGRKFQRPTVFEDQLVRENLMMARQAPARAVPVLFFRPVRRRPRPRGRTRRRNRPRRCARPQVGRTQPRPETMAGDRDASGAGPAGCCSSMNPPPA